MYSQSIKVILCHIIQFFSNSGFLVAKGTYVSHGVFPICAVGEENFTQNLVFLLSSFRFIQKETLREGLEMQVVYVGGDSRE